MKLKSQLKITTTMKKIKSILGIRKEAFELRFSKSLDQWEVIKDTRILYMGTKEGCQSYIKNMPV